MIKKISLDLKNIDSTIKSLKVASKEIKKLPNQISEEVAKLGKEYLDSKYASTPNDPNIVDIKTGVNKSTNGFTIYSRGKDVLYAEFGTGDEGAKDGHPAKWDFDLNPYNSGSTIRNVNSVSDEVKERLSAHGIISGNYWTYKKDGQDHVEYTQGIPSGKQMFDTGNYLKNKVIKDVSKKKVGEVLSKV